MFLRGGVGGIDDFVNVILKCSPYYSVPIYDIYIIHII